MTMCSQRLLCVLIVAAAAVQAIRPVKGAIRPAKGAPSLSRRALGAASAASIIGAPLAATAALTSGAALPLTTVRGGLAARYAVDGRAFLGVVDTGSPFLLVDGTCGELENGRWGCYPKAGLSPQFRKQGGLNDASLEIFGGQESIVEWRRGRVEVGRSLKLEPAVFGVVRSLARRGGEGGIYLGLIKHRQPVVRPTFLEQADAESIRVDLRDPEARTLAILTSRPSISKNEDAVPLMDLRAYGAPVEPYAAKVSKLVVNGETVRLQRPCLCVLDTGTTGLTMSESLLGNGFGGTDEIPLPGAAIKHVDVFLETESGSSVPLCADAWRGQEFPLVVTTARLPWFDKDTLGRLGRKGQDTNWQDPPHVIFAGLSFLDRQRLTIDVDDRRLALKGASKQEKRPEAKMFRGRSMYAALEEPGMIL